MITYLIKLKKLRSNLQVSSCKRSDISFLKALDFHNQIKTEARTQDCSRQLKKTNQQWN